LDWQEHDNGDAITGLELKEAENAKHATMVTEVGQEKDAQELQESPPSPTPASPNCKHLLGGALGGGEGCNVDSVDAVGRAVVSKVSYLTLPLCSCSAFAFNKTLDYCVCISGL